MTPDMRHLTPDRWHLKHYTWHVTQKCYVPSSYGFGSEGNLKIMRKMMTEGIHPVRKSTQKYYQSIYPCWYSKSPRWQTHICSKCLWLHNLVLVHGDHLSWGGEAFSFPSVCLEWLYSLQSPKISQYREHEGKQPIPRSIFWGRRPPSPSSCT